MVQWCVNNITNIDSHLRACPLRSLATPGYYIKAVELAVLTHHIILAYSNYLGVPKSFRKAVQQAEYPDRVCTVGIL